MGFLPSVLPACCSTAAELHTCCPCCYPTSACAVSPPPSNSRCQNNHADSSPRSPPLPCRPERVTLEDGTEISRPVIRIPELNLVLTRIDPQRKETSMVFRVREGWEQLRKYVAGEADGKKRCAWRRLCWLGPGCCAVQCLVRLCSSRRQVMLGVLWHSGASPSDSEHMACLRVRYHRAVWLSTMMPAIVPI